MKIKLFMSACLVSLISISAFSQSAKSTEETAVSFMAETTQKISWDSQEYDFGNLPQNVAAEAEFVFTNISNEPVTISKVKSSCGCTITAYEKNPVLPGQSSTITATYNAKSLGAFRKSVKVYTTEFQPYTLTIKGKVEAETSISAK